MHDLSHELPKDRKPRNKKISGDPLKCFKSMASVQPPTKQPNFDSCNRLYNIQLYNIPQKNLFYLISWICLQNFVQDLFVAPGSQLLKHSFQETLKRSFQDSLNPMYHCGRDTFLALHSHAYNWSTNSSKHSKWHWSKTLRKHWPDSNQYSSFWKRFFP